jgi:tetratricopeptide (TPR) repeat protein
MRFVAMAIVLVGSTAHADPGPINTAARERLEHGTALYASGNYEAAIGEFELGRQIDPNPDFEYALGQAYRKLGDCKHAVQHYMAFLDTLPESELAQRKVRTNIAHCPIPDEPSPPAPPPPVRTVAAPPPSIVITHDERIARPWYGDAPNAVIAGAGFGGLAVGVTYLVLADRDIATANAVKPIAQLQQLSATAHRERVIGASFTIGGGVLAATAIARYFILGRDRPADRVVSMSIDQTGAYAVWMGKF